MITFLEVSYSIKELKKEIERLKKLDWVSLLASPPVYENNDLLIEFSDGKEIWEDYVEEWEKAMGKGATHWRILSLPNKDNVTITNSSKM
jgi:hypothetical protein